jgi:hypothetical protein
LNDAEIEAKHALLSKMLVWVELGKERGKVAYTFPLRDADLCTAPPGECEQQDRSAPCRSGWDVRLIRAIIGQS